MKRELVWYDGGVHKSEVKNATHLNLLINDLLINKKVDTVGLYVNDFHLGFLLLIVT